MNSKSTQPDYAADQNAFCHRGFTLVELLVIVAIMVLLAAILFPVFARARESARRAACLSNLKNMGLGLMQYVQDYDERFPLQATPGAFSSSVYEYGNFVANPLSTSVPNYHKAIFQYTGSREIFLCPSSLQDPVQGGNMTDGNSSYLGNAVLMNRGLAAIGTPSAIVWMQERGVRLKDSYLRPRVLTDGAGNATTNPASFTQWHTLSSAVELFSNQHFGGGNLLFADGHAKWRKCIGLRSGDFGLSPDEPSTTANSAAGQTYTANLG